MAKSSKGTGPVEADIVKSDALKWRCIGPSRGGRVVAVAGAAVAGDGRCCGVARAWRSLLGMALMSVVLWLFLLV